MILAESQCDGLRATPPGELNGPEENHELERRLMKLDQDRLKLRLRPIGLRRIGRHLL